VAAMSKLAEDHQQQQPYDLVLLDMMMPEMDGWQVAQQINSDYGSQRPDIIMLTSTTIDPGDRHLSDLVDMMLLKPVRKLSLYNAILSLIDSHVPDSRMQETALSAKGHKRSLNNRILIAEDNHANQRVIENMLAGIGYDDFDTVENGQQVLNALKEKQYDIILMDIQMPVMDGLEATRVIRNSKQAFSSIAICAMTANAMHGDREKCLNAGMNDYLSKPIDLTKLRSMLSKWITNKNVVNFENSAQL
jgi:CheY-like chemotaxis protein